MSEFGLIVGAGKLRLHLANESEVLLETGAVLGPEILGDAGEILAHIVDDGDEALAVLHAAVDFPEHLFGIVDRRDGLIGTGVAHARPWIGAVWHGDAELE